MGFWSSFFRETGKNSGKWLSNKVFGSSWSTPYSIEHKHTPAPQRRRRKIDEGDFGLDEIEPRNDEAKPNTQALTEPAEMSLDFDGSSSEEIEKVMDRLFLELKSHETDTAINQDQAKFKIRTGIHKLRSLGYEQSAAYYENELNAFVKKEKSGQVVAIIFGIICLIGLILIAFGKF